MRKMETIENNKQKKIKAMEANPVVIDNHTDKPEIITGLVEFVDPEKGLACCFNARYYSLNACVIQDGVLHCSMASIGGVLWGAYPDEEQLQKYNDGCIFESGKIKCIHRPDGTKVYPKNSEENMYKDMSPFAKFFVDTIKKERA
jgi:hypothetical protein